MAEPELNAQEACYALMGWLTCRAEVLTLSRVHDAAPAAQVVAEFCQRQGFAPIRDGWDDRIVPPATPTMPRVGPGDVPVGFRTELTALLNRHSRENRSDTPDFILASFLVQCLYAFEMATVWRTKWYSPQGVPVAEQQDGPRVEPAP